MSSLQKVLVFSLLVLAGNGFIGYSVYRSNQKLRDSDKMVQHTELVLSQSADFLSLGKDIESSSRGYVITKDSSFLAPLIIAQKTVFSTTELLKELTKDNPLQQLKIDTLISFMHRRMGFSLTAIDIRNKKGLSDAIFFINTKKGKHFSDEMRRIVSDIQQEENTLLSKRKQINDSSIATLYRYSAVMFVLMTILIILLLITTANNLLKSKEKEKRAAELIIANKELAFQNEEKEKRASELVVANKELIFQNDEKEKRAAELIIANKELAFQNAEKEKRSDELVIANKELVFQNEEKAKRATELVIAKKDIGIQHEEKEKQIEANKELEAFSYSVSHDLRAPLRHIMGFIELLRKTNSSNLDETGIRYLNTISESSLEMGNLIDALLTFSRLSRAELQRTTINSKNMVKRVLKTFSDDFSNRKIELKISELPDSFGDESLINQVWVNLISNAIKYTRNETISVIEIGGTKENGRTVFFIKDNGVGFDMKYSHKLFGVFQRLHKARDFEGIGIGLANVNRIIVRHGGECWVESQVGNGAKFFFSIANN
jgi:signal transduction histidine kinase